MKRSPLLALAAFLLVPFAAVALLVCWPVIVIWAYRGAGRRNNYGRVSVPGYPVPFDPIPARN